MSVENSNRMQNVAALGGGGYFIDVRNMHGCYMIFDYEKNLVFKAEKGCTKASVAV